MDVLTTKPLPLAEWLSVLDHEYLSEYVPAGGASVKVAILDDVFINSAADQLIGLGEARAMLTVRVDADRTRIHMMHELFFAIARALPWDSLVQRYLEELFAAHAYAWPQPGAAMAMTDLAGAFAVAPSLLARQRPVADRRSVGRPAAGTGLPRRVAAAVSVASGTGRHRER